MFGIDVSAYYRRPRPRLLGGFNLTKAVAAMAWLATSTAAHASAAGFEDYVLSNVSANFNGTPESISGVFTVLSPGEEAFAQFQVTGPSGSVVNYSCVACKVGGIVSPIPISGDTIVAGGLQIGFANNFPSFGTDPVTSIEIGGITGINPTGTANASIFPQKYTFSGASTVLNGVSETITGNFGFDPLTDIEYGALIALVNQSGHTDLSCFFDAEPVGIGTVAEADCGRGFIQFDFANKLASAPDLLREVDLEGFAGISVDNAPTGVACPSGVPLGTCLAAVPEPPTLATLGSSLGTLLLGRWAVRRAGQPATDQPSGMSSTA